MKFSEIKTGMKVYDRNSPELRGEIVEVLKTRVKVRFLRQDDVVTYDQAHCQFLEETEGNKWKRNATTKPIPMTSTRRGS